MTSTSTFAPASLPQSAPTAARAVFRLLQGLRIDPRLPELAHERGEIVVEALLHEQPVAEFHEDREGQHKRPAGWRQPEEIADMAAGILRLGHVSPVVDPVRTADRRTFHHIAESRPPLAVMAFCPGMAVKFLPDREVAENAVRMHGCQGGGHVMGIFGGQMALQHQAVRVGLLGGSIHGFLRVSMPKTRQAPFL